MPSEKQPHQTDFMAYRRNSKGASDRLLSCLIIGETIELPGSLNGHSDPFAWCMWIG